MYPANLVFRGGRAVALIDFDLVGPGSAVWDFARGGAPAFCAAARAEGGRVRRAPRPRGSTRFRVFLAASGLPRADRVKVARALLANHDWTYEIVTEACLPPGACGFADHWRAVAPEAWRARRWLARHRGALIRAAA